MDQQAHMYSLVQEWQKSGMTKVEFTRQKAVGYHSFNYWINKYNKHHGSDTNNSKLNFFTVAESKISSDKKSNPKKESAKTICIELPSGIKISIY